MQPRLRIAITTPSNACRRFLELQQPILSLPRYHPDGRKVRPLHLLLFKLLNNVAHNLISYPGKLISRGLTPSHHVYVAVVLFRFELRQQPCLLFSQSQVFRSSGLLSQVRPSDCFKRQRRSRHGCPTVTLAELPSLLTPRPRIVRAIQQSFSKGIFRCRASCPSTPGINRETESISVIAVTHHH